MLLGQKIRDLRLRRGLTVQKLAEASGLSKGFVSQVENGRTSPSLATLYDIARSLETSVASLVVEEE
jgi:transcriptional regulator with XRE-family HTH domain